MPNIDPNLCMEKNCFHLGQHEYFFISIKIEDFHRLTLKKHVQQHHINHTMQKFLQMKTRQFLKRTERPCFARSPVGLGNTVLLCAGKMLSRKCFSCFKNYTQGFL